MTRLVDLTYTLDPRFRDLVPSELPELAAVVAPRIEYQRNEGFGREYMMKAFGCRVDDLPDGDGPAGELMNDISTHCGTHLDAPLHSSRTIEGKPARTIGDIELSELYRPGMVLDVRPWAAPGEGITVDMLRAALDAVGRDIQDGDAVLIRTGQERYTMADPMYFNYPGMTGAGTRFLTGRGATVLGTDAVGWDRPIPVMRKAFQETGDAAEIWDGHYAIRDKEAFIVQQMENLGALPPTGFMLGIFPLKLTDTSASPARAVAFVPDPDRP